MSLITIKATAKHTSTVLLMHGLGDSGHGWQPFVEEVKSQVPHITWLLPSAPLLKVTLNNGYKMPAWYDIKSLGSGGRNQDKPGILNSVVQMTGILNQHVKETGIERNRIIIAGFSQGGAMSLALAALSDYKYSAFLVMSGYLPLHNEIADMLRPLNLQSKILMCHGTRDEVVQFNWGKESYNELKNLGFDDVDFKEFDVGHGTNDDEVEYVVEWLKKVTS